MQLFAEIERTSVCIVIPRHNLEFLPTLDALKCGINLEVSCFVD